MGVTNSSDLHSGFHPLMYCPPRISCWWLPVKGPPLTFLPGPHYWGHFLGELYLTVQPWWREPSTVLPYFIHFTLETNKPNTFFFFFKEMAHINSSRLFLIRDQVRGRKGSPCGHPQKSECQEGEELWPLQLETKNHSTLGRRNVTEW